MAASMMNSWIIRSRVINLSLIQSVRHLKFVASKQNLRRSRRGEKPRNVYVRPSKGEQAHLSFEEKQKLLNPVDAELEESIDIGFPVKPQIVKTKEIDVMIKKMKLDADLERQSRNRKLIIDLEQVDADWMVEKGPSHVKTILEHYGVFNDLFGKAFFLPKTKLNIAFDFNDDEMTPVFYGNKILPENAETVPIVSYESDDSSLWTIIMTSPDEHLLDNNKEYLHWFQGNIPGSEVNKGQLLCDYMQPIPMKGTGYHRYIFILYKQDRLIDYNEEQRIKNCCSLAERTFSTYEFYRRHQDDITPAGVSFFLSEWDSSVQQTFRNKLGMREPVFEFDYPQEYHHPQVRNPKRKPFNKYLDYYRDRKEIAEEIFRKRLDMISPFKDYPQRLKYENIFHIPDTVPTWKKDELNQERLRTGKYKDLP